MNLGPYPHRDASQQLPEELRNVALQFRAVFGPGVRLKFAAWDGGQAGRPEWDEGLTLEVRNG